MRRNSRLEAIARFDLANHARPTVHTMLTSGWLVAPAPSRRCKWPDSYSIVKQADCTLYSTAIISLALRAHASTCSQGPSPAKTCGSAGYQLCSFRHIYALSCHCIACVHSLLRREVRCPMSTLARCAHKSEVATVIHVTRSEI